MTSSFAYAYAILRGEHSRVAAHAWASGLLLRGGCISRCGDGLCVVARDLGKLLRRDETDGSASVLRQQYPGNLLDIAPVRDSLIVVGTAWTHGKWHRRVVRQPCAPHSFLRHSEALYDMGRATRMAAPPKAILSKIAVRSRELAETNGPRPFAAASQPRRQRRKTAGMIHPPHGTQSSSGLSPKCHNFAKTQDPLRTDAVPPRSLL